MSIPDKWCANCRHLRKPNYEEPCKSCTDGDGYSKLEQEEAIVIKLEKRPELLPWPLPIYERTDSEIPERIKISFANGTSAIYDLHTDQPAPVIIENIKIIRRKE